MMDRQIIVLTGGIASGKTLASNYLGTLNAHVIDTDVIARQLLQKDGNPYSQTALTAVKAAFGDEIFKAGVIDRVQLRALIFSDPVHKTTLENIMHPLIHQRVQDLLGTGDGSYDLVVVPLLHEGSPYVALADQILVIEVDEEIQLERVMARDHIDETLAKRIIDSQPSNQVRRALANTIILNTNAEYTQKVLKQLDKQYSLAPSKNRVT
ncbi:dephospho-CoA kinase [Wohlfahrtiimonas chitiniclastica]|uniref:dephospho-CoA kinase n=1 Tax=Wohlfahrtiimonas chitiniclastica TaxID=400946 RepID=UPI0007BE7332|nr:dephospho-CoA kinase [Wohlfahrtiimonas chitiniclastica]KZS23056.1 dephospho-CoA kinase [Wohlfahrtiimonas chitiniclastica]MDC7252308.1 dephospho-CoA kinase [Wohlfahrtiimonas chitiniclastica]WHR55488.1 dephospho-CoA kinase [Wohlfahrtiimonas chitiniclastica]